MPKHILIIEDENLLREVLVKKFIHEGYKVDSAVNGEEGLELIGSANPDVVLLDILMPKMNGFEVLKKLQEKNEAIPPIIIISNSGQPVEVDKAISLGAKDYIVKAQITPEEVVSKIKKMFERGNERTASVEPKIEAKSFAPTKDDNSEHKILLIEDDQFLRDLMRTKLNREGFEVLFRIDGKEGLRAIQTEKPDLVLLDVILPGIDGFSVLQQIRSSGDPEVAKVPIVLLSNLGQDSDVAKGKQLGANDYLIKSNLTIDEIIKKIRVFLK